MRKKPFGGKKMEGLQADLPYPETAGISEDAYSVRVISPAYADRGSEMTAILQYVFQAIVLQKQGLEEYAKTLERIAVAEMHHLEMLGSLLYQLGALPVFTSRPPRKFDFYSTGAVSYASDVRKMILDDILGETQAIYTYEEMIRKLKDEKVSAIIARIVLDEKLHLETLKNILRELNEQE